MVRFIMNLQEALKILNIEDYAERIWHSNSHGELFHLDQYFTLAETFKDDAKWFRDWFESIVKFAEENSNTTPYKPDENNIVFRYLINDELVSIHFSKGLNGELIYRVKKLSENQKFVNDESSHKYENDKDYYDNI